MKNYHPKILRIVIVSLIIACFGIATVPGWATSSDPLVSKSWVDQYVKAKFDQLDTQVATIQTAINQYKASQARHVVLWLNNRKALVNNKEYTLDVLPVVKNNFILVPMRFIGEALGITVNWNNQSKSVICNSGTSQVVLPLNAKTAKVNGKTVTLDCAPIAQNGRIMVPTRFIAQSFGATVNWDNTQKKVDIYK